MLEPRIGRRRAVAGILEVRHPGINVIRWKGPERDRAEDVHLDGAQLQGSFGPGDRVPCRAGLLEWSSAGQVHRVEVRLAPGSRPAPLVAAVLHEVSRALRMDDPARVPLVRVEGLKRFLTHRRIDDLLDRVGAELFEVCDRPRPKLITEELWQDLSRVRRPARRAAQALMRNTRYLGHPGRRSGVATPGMPRPERLLTEVVEESFDRYENRFVATLVDVVGRRLALRTEDSDAALEALVEGREELTLVHELGMWHQSARLRDRLGMAEETVAELAARCEELVDQLGRQQRHLRSARASRLFDAVSRAPRVRPPIRPTNLLVHDLNYGPLHDAWVELHKPREPEPLHPVDDDPDVAHAGFCGLLLGRALAEAGFERSGPWALPGSGEATTWTRRDPAGPRWTVEVEADGDTDLRVAITSERPGRTGRVPSQQWIVAPRYVSLARKPEATLEALRRALRPGDRRVLWLVAQGPEEPSALGIGVHAPADGQDGVAVASPLRFSSVDRVGTWLLARTVGEVLRAGVALGQCPVCLGTKVEGDPNERRCGDCGAAWGWQECRSCRERIPTLVPARPDSEDLAILAPEPAAGELAWLRFVDRVLGRDRVGKVEAPREEPGSFRWGCVGCG